MKKVLLLLTIALFCCAQSLASVTLVLTNATQYYPYGTVSYSIYDCSTGNVLQNQSATYGSVTNGVQIITLAGGSSSCTNNEWIIYGGVPAWVTNNILEGASNSILLYVDQSLNNSVQTVYTSTWDPLHNVYILTTNTINPAAWRYGYSTNYFGFTNTPGVYSTVYSSVWNPGTYRYELQTNYVRLFNNRKVITITYNSPPVSPQYGLPIATNFTISIPQNSSLAVDVLAHVMDTNRVTPVIFGVVATNGTAFNQTSNVLYTATPNFVGTDLVNYVVADITGLYTNGSFTVIITNQAPTVGSLPTISMPRFTSTSLDLTPYLIDPAGYALTLTKLKFELGSASANGLVLTLNEVTNILSTSNMIFSTYNGFTYVTNNIRVTTVDQAPIATNFVATTLRDTPITVHPLNFSFDPDGDALSLVGYTSTNNCTAVMSGNNLIVTPATGSFFPGSLNYQISDGYVTSSGSITLIVGALSPQLTNSSFTIHKLVTTNYPVLFYAYSPYSLPLTIYQVFPTNCTAMVVNTNVQILCSSVGSASVGCVLTDGAGHFGAGVINVTVNDPLQTTNFIVSTMVNNPANVNFVANSFSTAGDTIKVSSYGSPAGGAFSGDPNSSLTFTPLLNTTSTNTVNYTVYTDGGAVTANGTLTLTVTDVPPVVVNQSLSVLRDGKGTNFPLLAASSPTSLPLTVSLGAATHGTATTDGNQIKFVPTSEYIGGATVGYTVSDTLGKSTTGTLTVTVTNSHSLIASNFNPNAQFAVGWIPNIPMPIPTAITSISAWPYINFPVPIAPLTQVWSPDGFPVTLSSITPITNCTPVIDGTGTNIDYVLTNANSTAVINYTVSDGLNSASGTISIPAGITCPVVTNWSNNLHNNFSGSVTIYGYGLSQNAHLMLLQPPGTSSYYWQHSGPSFSYSWYYPGIYAGFGSCPPVLSGQSLTWPGTGCHAAIQVISSPQWTTLTPPDGTGVFPNFGNVSLIMTDDSGFYQVLTNHFVPLP